MNQAKGMVQSTMRDISNAVEQAKGVLATLGLTATAGGLALLVKNAIDAADSMNDLSKSTGIAVEKLAGLRLAAKQSGGDLDGIAQSINKLSVNIGKSGDKFRELGINSKDPLEAFKQFADVFSAIDDPQLKAALGAEALGKQWASAAPLLSEGGKKIGEMVEKGEKLAGITKEITEASDAFNDKLVELGGNGGTMNGILREMLPLLNKVLDDFISLKGEGGGLGQVLGGALTEALRVVVVLAGNVGFVLRGIGNEIGGIAAQVVAFLSGDFKRAGEIGRMMTADAEAARAKFDAWEASIMAIGTAATKTAQATAGMSEEDLEAARIAKDAADAANKKARAFLAGADAAQKAAKAQKELGLADAHVVAFLKIEAELRESVARAIAQGAEERRRYIDGIEEEIRRQEWQNDTLGMTREQIALLVVARLEERMAILKASGAMETEIAQLQEEIDLRRKLADAVGRGEAGRAAIDAQNSALRDQASVWGEISRTAGDFFADLVMNGKSAFENLRNYAKRFLADLISIFAQRWVLNMVGQGTLAASVGQGTLAGSLASGGLGGLISGGGGMLASGLGSLGFGGASQFVGGATGAIAGPALPGSALAMGQGLAGVGSMIASAMPYIAAAVIAYQLFAPARGGPKEGGSYFGQFTSFGDYLGQGRVPGTDNGRFFTPSGSDSQVAGIGSGAAAQYYATARALGLNAGAFSFGLGFDTDPRGTAPNRVSSGLVDASGRVIYGARDRDIGRDSSAITPALQLEASRMVAAAIKASELPAYLRKVFDGLVVDTASQQQIDDAMNTAAALKQIFDVLSRNPMEDLATQVEASQNQYEAALKANARAMREAIDQFDGTAASTQKLSAATVQYYNAQLQLMAAIAQVSEQINAMFGDTFRNIQLAGLDSQGKYNFYQRDAEEARKLIATATDPEMIRQLASRINSDINSAFGLLSPEEQRAMSAQFITQGQGAQSEINARLKSIQSEAAAATQTMLGEIKALLEMNAEDFKQAGADIREGGNAIRYAADRGVTVRIVDSRGNPIVNGG